MSDIKGLVLFENREIASFVGISSIMMVLHLCTLRVDLRTPLERWKSLTIHVDSVFKVSWAAWIE